jgi:hypothetical protein
METQAKLILLFEKYSPIINPLYKICVAITYIGGPLTSLWVLWMTYTSPRNTFWFSFIVLLSVVIGFKFGMAPLFAVSCSWTFFYFDRFGISLPIIAYIIAIIMLVLQLAANRIIKSAELH